MRFKFTILTVTIIFSIFLTACPSSNTPTSNNTGNTNTANNQPTANSNSPIVPSTPKPETATTNNAPTLAPIVQAYYDALKKKDDAAIKKVLSAELVKKLEAEMKEEGKTSLAAYIAELDKVPEKPVEVRNEKIEGDKGTAELKGGVNPNWTVYVFRKEGGTWRMTDESPDNDAVNKSVNSNAATNK